MQIVFVPVGKLWLEWPSNDDELRDVRVFEFDIFYVFEWWVLMPSQLIFQYSQINVIGQILSRNGKKWRPQMLTLSHYIDAECASSLSLTGPITLDMQKSNLSSSLDMQKSNLFCLSTNGWNYMNFELQISWKLNENFKICYPSQIN